MELYHVTSYSLFQKYLTSGKILPPVRAWRSLDGATRFGKQTNRRLIIRLTAGKHFRELGGHQGQALVSDRAYEVRAEDFE